MGKRARMDRRARVRRPDPASTGTKLAFALAAVALLIAGPWMVVGFVITRVDIAQKQDRLPREGAEVTAAVVELHTSRRYGVEDITLAYQVDGRPYRKRIMCAGWGGCHNRPGPTMQIWVDPAAPAEFVAANKNTDNSRSFFNSIFILGLGLFLTTIGGIFTFVRLTIDHTFASAE